MARPGCDTLQPHPENCWCHDSILASGSPTVYVNSLQISRIGDPVACGSSVMTGSPDVFAGP
ncbi:PAAR domain-containing protein [Roseospira visakhapatnamensis]|uniref:PAAR domain-containing protein n=1 Tax=Roseospira visakhapatnamensis TaxID=390880 RepID=UPI001616D6BA